MGNCLLKIIPKFERIQINEIPDDPDNDQYLKEGRINLNNIQEYENFNFTNNEMLEFFNFHNDNMKIEFKCKKCGLLFDKKIDEYCNSENNKNNDLKIICNDCINKMKENNNDNKEPLFYDFYEIKNIFNTENKETKKKNEKCEDHKEFKENIELNCNDVNERKNNHHRFPEDTNAYFCEDCQENISQKLKVKHEGHNLKDINELKKEFLKYRIEILKKNRDLCNLIIFNNIILNTSEKYQQNYFYLKNMLNLAEKIENEEKRDARDINSLFEE